MTRPPEEPAAEEPLRIVRGSAEPEELAALTVVLCGRLAQARALADSNHGGSGADGLTKLQLRNHSAHAACWAGCWTCG
ncbi:acyl-CoA carboxylase subunit epsilon (plasmid) [Streptomyces sp. BHT-5-2]|uniref:acyl-CoA carboxylase subunit epsilon n=1 Tax=unclassified Streptomyces TaxID=2593676 RepID=UPI001C8EC556|nr:acyl-CoA carboxylase subunit epsilon [Streptomyces sp. BHT-5-2]QZL07561.1 acyl-CoA carboxylase subunit epsilon [Streptomyces sp. BHT-5-2]